MNNLINLPYLICYAWVDGCVLYLKQDGDHFYLGISIDEGVDLLAPLSKQRLLDIENNKVDLFTAFKQTEFGYVYRTSELNKIEKVNCEELSTEDLPYAGIYLNHDNKAEHI